MSVNLSNTRFFALIPCAGHGSRAGTSGPKQYEPIAGQPMVLHTLGAFAAVKRIAKTLVVVAQGDGGGDGELRRVRRRHDDPMRRSYQSAHAHGRRGVRVEDSGAARELVGDDALDRGS